VAGQRPPGPPEGPWRSCWPTNPVRTELLEPNQEVRPDWGGPLGSAGRRTYRRC